MQVMPEILVKRMSGAHAADLQNKYQKNVAEDIHCVHTEQNIWQTENADILPHWKCDGLLKCHPVFLKPTASLPLTKTKLTTSLQEHISEKGSHDMSRLELIPAKFVGN